ncbi:MAG: type II toxin-antitoxin system Phd/YefM family antitoxin [Roseiflexus sp.]|nr:type II toxin-antitoxin system Phd/YefM family antitoxin [Roseiflexus sp.]MCS7290544.1 type II toxin-antitoxin system Phd/YefM family antitoxin [Roseiflexus sp.]MDW8148316.1 type II toxin-antitoxin system Phd/YefM family antitoxin [Roseiflexaceae bacterium]MDW8232345.1 type II toxin-antitoxin system Phd/YefM family antitoxin [Roseiflexaceae bacterium]
MPVQTTCMQARARPAALLDEAVNNRDTVIIQRHGGEDAALIAADKLQSLLETVHLLHSPANPERLLATPARAQRRSGTPQSIDDLRREVELAENE